MKRAIIVIIILVLIGLGYRVVAKGIEIDKINLDIASYKEIKTSSEGMTKSLAAYNKKNKDEYETSLTNLTSAIKRYQTAKEQYGTLVEELGVTESEEEETEPEVIVPSKKAYEIDYLLTTVGTYGNKENVDIDMTLVKNGNQDSSLTSLGITSCNLQFKAEGNYIDIANFLYDLEDDDELAFEIRDYAMTASTATFTVYSVPINSETLIEVQQQQQTTDTTQQSGTTDPNSTNTVDNTTTGNTVNNAVQNETSNNTISNNATSNTTTNTVSNSISNNTVR